MNSRFAFLRQPSNWPMFALTLLFLFSSSIFAIAASKPAEIRSIQMTEGIETDFVVEASGNFQFYMFALKNPERLVIDCRSAVLRIPRSQTLHATHPDVVNIRADQFQPDVVRIVFDLRHPAKYSALMNGSNLRVRIVDKRQVQAARQPLPSYPASKADVEMSVSTEDSKKRINIQKPETKKNSVQSRLNMKGYLVDKFRRNVVRGEDSEPSMTNSYALSLRYKDKKQRSTFKIHYDIVGHEYMEPFLDDYMTHDVKIGYKWKWGSNWSIKTVGRAELYDYVDQYGVRPELIYEFSPRTSFSFYGGHRTKVFHDYRERVDQDRFLGLEYTSRLPGNHILELSYQRNFNDSENERYDYTNSKYSVRYSVPWNKRVRTLFRVDYSPREYQARYISPEFDDFEFGTLRHDYGLTFSVASRFALTKTFDIVPRYVFQEKYSNDPSIFENAIHVPSITLRGRW